MIRVAVAVMWFALVLFILSLMTFGLMLQERWPRTWKH